MTNQIQQTIAERGKQYGSFDDVATVSQRLKGILHSANPSIKLNAVQREAVDMICTKLARICAGWIQVMPTTGAILRVMRCWVGD